MLKLFRRYEGNPILKPSQNPWESMAVLNAAAIKVDGEYRLIYRAINDKNISSLGYAVSKDGINFTRFSEPLLQAEENNEYEAIGIEDPRITLFEGEYCILYTSASLYKDDRPLPTWSNDKPWRIRVSLKKTRDFKKFERVGIILPDIDTKDAVLFPKRIGDKITILHREYPNICICSGDSWNNLSGNKIVATPRVGMWDCSRIGAGGPPIKTKDGWLMIYHGVDEQRVYRQGAMLLDLNDPSQVIARSGEPFIEPTEEYEKNGVVNNVVFSCGAVLEDDNLIVYYGGADKVICVGTVSITQLISSLIPEKVKIGLE